MVKPITRKRKMTEEQRAARDAQQERDCVVHGPDRHAKAVLQVSAGP